MISLCALLMVTAPAPLPSPDAARDDDRVFAVSDGGATRLLVRGPTPGRDDAPADVLYVDPASGRSAHARIGSTVIVQLPDVVDDAVARTILVALDVEPVRPLFRAARLWLARSSRMDEDGVALAARLAAHTGPAGSGAPLVLAFPDLHLRHRIAALEPAITIPPDDPRYAAQFFLEDLDIEAAWALSIGSPEVVVAVVDNGCDLQQQDLIDKYLPGHDVVDDDDDPSYAPNDDGNNGGNEHGTACAGLVAATTDNGIDVAGACPLCRVTCTRLLGPNDAPGVPLNADVRAFGHAFDDNVDVVSNSWGFVDAIPVPEVLKEAIVQVQQNGRDGKGAVVVFAAGNDSRQVQDDELLAVDGVLGVGAVTNLGEIAQFSNSGPSLDVVAPVGQVTTDITGADGASPGTVTTTFGGTSSACPLVAGIAGLVLAVDPDLTADEVNQLLIETARQSALATPDENGHDLEYGYGLVQPATALATFIDPDTGRPAPRGCGCTSTTPDATAAALLALLAIGPFVTRARRRP